MCICALVVRSKDTAVTFDVCTKGYMRVWAKSLHSSDMKNDHKIQEEFLGLKGLKESKHVLDNITKDGIEDVKSKAYPILIWRATCCLTTDLLKTELLRSQRTQRRSNQS